MRALSCQSNVFANRQRLLKNWLIRDAEKQGLCGIQFLAQCQAVVTQACGEGMLAVFTPVLCFEPATEVFER